MLISTAPRPGMPAGNLQTYWLADIVGNCEFARRFRVDSNYATVTAVIQLSTLLEQINGFKDLTRRRQIHIKFDQQGLPMLRMSAPPRDFGILLGDLNCRVA